jgi:anti-sigma factor RsiW
MSCRLVDGLVSGGREAEFAAHRALCPECATLGLRIDDVETLGRSLATPALPPTLRASLLAIPQRTVSCEGADALLAMALEGEIEPGDEARRLSHLSRCDTCLETAETLFSARGLTAPQPSPWLATRLSAGRPASARRKRGGVLSLLWSPRGAIALAYAAAVVVMFSGFNPADLARKAGMARLENATGAAVIAAREGAVERIGALQERAYISFEAWKGRLAGYGRATLANALALVMKTDPPRPPDRPKNGDGRGVPETMDGVCLTAKPAPAAQQIIGRRA